MKKLLALVMAIMLLTVGCSNGASVDGLKETYEAEVMALEDQLTSMSSELETSQEILAEKDEELNALKDELELSEDEKVNLMTDYQTLQSEYDVLVSKQSSIPAVVAMSEIVVELIRDQDFATLSTYVDPTLGLRFTPYPYINIGTDLVMSPAQVSAFGTDPTIYNWGNYDGSGDPIDLNPMDYYATFVYNADFADPEMMSWNAPIGSGNMINNMTSVYPTADYVEFYFSGFDPSYSGMDWTGLTLVFEQVGPDWFLVGVVHGQWTI